MYIVDIANNIYLIDLSEPDDVSIASIAAGLRSKIGRLNNLLGTNFSINSSLEISQDSTLINENQSDILKLIYLIDYYTRQIKIYLGIGGVESITEIASDGGVVRISSKTEIAKSYIQLRKVLSAELKTLVNKYKQGSYVPQGVFGDDTLTPNITYPQSSSLYNRNLDDSNLPNNGGI